MKTIFNRNYCFGLVIKFLNYAGYFLTTPLLVTHLTALGIDAGKAGVISGILFAAMAVSRPFAGYLSDRMNTRKILLITTAVYVFSFAGVALAKTFPMILFFRVLYGVGLCLLTNAADTWLLSDIPKERMGIAVSVMGLIPAVSSAVFPSVGLKIIEQWGTAAVFTVSAGLSLLILLPVLFMQNTPAPAAERHSLSVSDFIDFQVVPYALIAGSFAVAIGIVHAFWVTTAKGNGLSDTGLFFTVSAAVMVLLKLVCGVLTDQKDLKLVVVPSFVFTILALLLIPKAATAGGMVVCAILFAFSQGSGQPAMQIQCCRMVPASRRGVAISTFYLGISLGQAIGNISGGLLLKVFGAGCAYSFSAVLMVVSLAAFFVMNRKKTGLTE